MTKKTITSLILAAAICATTSCQSTVNGEEDPSGQTEKDSLSDEITVSCPEDTSQFFTSRDMTPASEENAVSIRLSDKGASSSSDAVIVSGNDVAITEEGTYILSGTVSDGSITVAAKDDAKVFIILDNASVTSADSAALLVISADKVVVTLKDNTENSFATTGEFIENEYNADAAVFSKQDISFNGGGSLSVECTTAKGIVCKDSTVFYGGSYSISCASHAIDANDSVCIGGKASLVLCAGKDAIHAENSDDANLGFVYTEVCTLDIEAEGDGISAVGYLLCEGSTLNILAGGGHTNAAAHSSDGYGSFMGKPQRPGGGGFGGDMGSFGKDETPAESTESTDSTSMKGIKAVGELVLLSSDINIDSADDGVHSDTSIRVEGGSITVASGDDGFHADEKLQILSGTICITESYEGLEALELYIEGGNITLSATDDGLNAAGGQDSSGMGGMRPDKDSFSASGASGKIVISGGELHISASGDGIDSNGSLEISGGYTVVQGPSFGDTSTLDYDSTAVITGGVFIGTGAAGMAQVFSSWENQGIIALSASNQQAGAEIVIASADGEEVLSFTPELSFSVIIVSSPDIVSGEKYSVTVGSDSGEFEAF